MNDAEYVEFAEDIRRLVETLTTEVIVEECGEDEAVEGCMSCEAFRARAHLKAILEIMTPPINS